MNRLNRFEGHARGLTWFFAVLLSTLAAGCGNSGGQDPVVGAGDVARILPTVTAVTPVPDATGVPVNTKLMTATFGMAMDSATITPASFTLACPAATPVAGTVAYVGASNMATLTLPAATNLVPNTKCTATVTTAARDARAGFPLADDFIWIFTTGAAPDTTVPTVTRTFIANGATNVAINSKAGVTFSEGMDPLTINTNTLTLKQGATAVPGTVSYSGQSAVFVPLSTLAAHTTYTATVTTGASDLAGNALASDYVWTWSTGGDIDTAPPITTAGPSISDIANTSATFSVTINENGTGYYLIGLTRFAPPSVETVLSLGGSFALSANVAATFAIKGLSGIPLLNNYSLYFVAKDASNNVQPDLQRVSFSTIPDTVRPTTTAAPSVSGTTATTTTFSVTIDENGTGWYLVQPAAADAPSVAAIQSSGGTFAMSANVAVTVVITGLTASAAYTIYFVARDTSLNMQAAVQSVAFSTAAR